MKETLWTGGFVLAIMLPFLIFVAAGWPGTPDSCVSENDAKKPSATENSCYCEPFELKDIGKPGVRQPFNTWSNLYALGTAVFLIIVIYRNRKYGDTSGPNRMRSTDLYPIFYTQVAIFLGLGSMWFHASIVNWGGIFDQMSMYTTISFLIAYSLTRWRNVDLYFYICFPMLLFALFIIALFGVSSVIVISIALVPYTIIELIIWSQDDTEKTAASIWEYGKFWFIGLGSFLLAVLLRGLSDTGGPLCIHSSAFQFHGVWHILCGLMAIMLYFHWRYAKR